jgi:hypothetical protein
LPSFTTPITANVGSLKTLRSIKGNGKKGLSGIFRTRGAIEGYVHRHRDVVETEREKISGAF